jgi:DNA-binding NtrC family response regulator
VLHLHIPPLRERAAAVPMLLEYYGKVFAQQHERSVPVLSPAALEALVRYEWPGNIRELRNIVERLVTRVDAEVIELAHLPAELSAGPSRDEAPQGSHNYPLSNPVKVAALLERLRAQGESFWTTAYAAFMSRDITRNDLRYIIATGLEETHGSYRLLLGLYNMAPGDYRRLLGFLSQHECHVPFGVPDGARR